MPASHVRYVSLGVLIEQETLDNPWQPYRWRVAEVLMDPPPAPEIWQRISGGSGGAGGAGRFHGGVHQAEMHRKETASYKINLEGGEPSVYVVMTEPQDGSASAPVVVQLVTLSPDEAQAYGSSGFETVERVAMPSGLVPILAAFVAEHHVEETFVKRQRGKARPAEEQFGQEPIFTRGRRGRRAPGNGSDGAT